MGGPQLQAAELIPEGKTESSATGDLQ